MATRQDVVNIALGQDGYHSYQGYDEISKYTQSFGIDYGIAYCDIFISWCYEQAGVPLPKMGSWIRSGSQYCPESWAYAVNHGAARGSQYDAQPGDQVIFNWNGNYSPLGGSSHTEMVVSVSGGVLYTVGGNSGPAGGVNQHAWTLPNSLIQGVIDTSQLVTFNANEEFVMDAEAKAAFAALTGKLDQMIQVFEGGQGSDPKKNPYGLVGTRDLWTYMQKIGAKVGVKP